MISQKDTPNWKSFYHNQLLGMRLYLNMEMCCLSWEQPIILLCAIWQELDAKLPSTSEVELKDGAMRTLPQSPKSGHGALSWSLIEEP